mmetsp:Transcript_138668/g.345831  ORF Transcript_138668/g.345831 Transcript_138668/m.345831 type:complete len:247 (-) Transcript_138668:50-790(-)
MSVPLESARGVARCQLGNAAPCKSAAGTGREVLPASLRRERCRSSSRLLPATTSVAMVAASAAVAACLLQCSGCLLSSFVAAPSCLAPRPFSAAAAGDPSQTSSLLRARKQKASATEVSPVLRKMKEEQEAKEAAEAAANEEEPDVDSGKIMKRSLDEVLAAANDDSDRPNYLPMKRDVYKEVGITQAEVEAYWDRRDEGSSNYVDKLAGPGYVFLLIAFFVIAWSVWDSIVNPQENVLASMTGLD